MPTGDTLTLITLAIGSMIGAFNLSGWRATVAWFVTAASLVLAAVYAGALPSFGVSLVNATSLVNALVAPITIGLVAMMLRERRPADPPAPPSESVDQPPHYNPRRSGLSNALIEVWKARNDARAAVAERRSNAESTVSRMESALATVRRTFEIETPAPTGNSLADLKTWLDFFDVVWPFVEGGNYEQAQARAVHFITDRGLQLEQ